MKHLYKQKQRNLNRRNGNMESQVDFDSHVISCISAL